MKRTSWVFARSPKGCTFVSVVVFAEVTGSAIGSMDISSDPVIGAVVFPSWAFCLSWFAFLSSSCFFFASLAFWRAA